MNVDLAEKPAPLFHMLRERGESERESHEVDGEGHDPERGHDARRHRAEPSPCPTRVEVEER